MKNAIAEAHVGHMAVNKVAALHHAGQRRNVSVVDVALNVDHGSVQSQVVDGSAVRDGRKHGSHAVADALAGAVVIVEEGDGVQRQALDGVARAVQLTAEGLFPPGGIQILVSKQCPKKGTL